MYKQKRLVEELAKPDVKSVRNAAIKAGYAESTASTVVYRPLENTRIKEAVQHRINRALKHHKVTPEEVLGNAAFLCVRWNGKAIY
ncbi:MAG: terminase small subunit [Aridibacter sp.]